MRRTLTGLAFAGLLAAAGCETGDELFEQTGTLQLLVADRSLAGLLAETRTNQFTRWKVRRAEMDVFIDWFNEVWKRDPNGIDDELAGKADQAAMAAMSERMAASLDLFERMLDGRDYLMGDEVSAADFAAFPFLKYATIPKLPDDDEQFHAVLDDHLQPDERHSGLRAWIERIDALPRA